MLYDRVRDEGSSVIEVGWIPPYIEGNFHRSKDKKSAYNPFTSYMMNKKWTLQEEFNNHLLRFQQVTVSSIRFSKLHFFITEWIDNQ